MVGMRHRFRNDLLLLKTEVEQQQLGELQYLHGFWHTEPSSSSRWFAQKERAGGGVLTDLGIVLLDLFRWFVPAPVSAPSTAQPAIYACGNWKTLRSWCWNSRTTPLQNSPSVGRFP